MHSKLTTHPPSTTAQVLYRAAKARFDEDEGFKTRAREAVTRLQGGDPAALEAWARICGASRAEFQKIYDRLGVQLEERGESFYNPLLKVRGAALIELGGWVRACRGVFGCAFGAPARFERPVRFELRRRPLGVLNPELSARARARLYAPDSRPGLRDRNPGASASRPAFQTSARAPWTLDPNLRPPALKQDVVDELVALGVAVPSKEAICFFIDGPPPPDAPQEELDRRRPPLIVRKGDGGYGYASTDMAAVRHRVRDEGADRIVYITDAGQALHFESVFAAAEAAGYLAKPGAAGGAPWGGRGLGLELGSARSRFGREGCGALD